MDTLPICPNCNIKEDVKKEIIKDNRTFFKNNNGKLEVNNKNIKTWKKMIEDTKRSTKGKILGSKLHEEFNNCVDEIEFDTNLKWCIISIRNKYEKRT